MATRHRALALIFGIVIVTGATTARAQQAPAVTDQGKLIEERIRPLLALAQETLHGEHTLGVAVSYIHTYATTHKTLVADLKALSKTEEEGTRNVALWCLETAYPDGDTAWKAILRDGEIVDQPEMKAQANSYAFFITSGALDLNLSADTHLLDEVSQTGQFGPAMKVADFIRRYGIPDRRRTIRGKDGKDHRWLYYGPIGVELDIAEANVLHGVSMPMFLWIAAMESYDVNVPRRSAKERVPDLRQVFLQMGSNPR